jgi:polyferredoxin
MTSDATRPRARIDKLARKLVQVGFLLLCLYPFVPLIYKRITFRPSPTLASWILPFDPLLMLGELLRRDWTALAIGGPLLLIALTLIFGRAFCGWICPVGTVLDLIRPMAFWQKRKNLAKSRGILAKLNPFPASRNSRVRYYVLIAALTGGALSLQMLGLLDPLVIFHRAATAINSNAFALRQPVLRVYLSAVSLILLGIVLLELWQPRFWCRNVCPLGALISVFSRWSLLNRRVSDQCNSCADCRRICPMNAIGPEPRDTDYGDCTFCLECESACSKRGITFGWGTLAGKTWQRESVVKGEDGLPQFKGRYAPGGTLSISRRHVLGGIAASVTGLALVPVVQLAGQRRVIRPPGALPEDEFTRTCIACQECVRVCPTGGLRPTLLESGLAGIGTPQLVPRQGGCALNPSCPNLCAEVCPVGAIRPIKPEDLKLGIARVNRSLCLAWDQGVKCIVCVEACLVNAAQAYNGRVTVDPQRCTGCGRCESGCPVAGSAIHVQPL